MCIEKLEKLTEQIEFSEISTREGDHTVYDVKKGTAFSFDILRTDKIDVFKSFLSAGTVFPLHEHEESDEKMILLTGKVSVVCESEEEENYHELEVGVPFLIHKCVKHFLSVKEDSWLIAIIVPPDSKMLK